ncbi:trypsin beta isoform X2 [Daphnia magna]|uniref:trypsin beta isoform X2 n=1 Tax=Daphnia magna TaxID=35525 RepID=UPI001E1BD78F|nr:trypsin beta isoform X2 [Daphnia magna]
MRSYILFLAFAFSATSALPAPNADRIFGGALATPGQFPYVVSITDADRHYCNGFIYSARWIITTASCIDGRSVSKLKVIAGQVNAINPDVKEQVMSVYTITASPLYNSTTGYNDIALIMLTADIVFDYVNVDFVAYNEVDNTLTATAMGWGATFEGGLESVNLHYGEVDLLPMDSATTCGVYDNTKFNFSTMLCAVASATATPAGSPCQYDEGSPLVQMFGNVPTAVGILSKTEGCLAAAHGVMSVITIKFIHYLSPRCRGITKSPSTKSPPTCTTCTKNSRLRIV